MSQTLNILRINASSRSNGSVTRQLSDELISSMEDAGTNIKLNTRDTYQGTPFVDDDWIAANFTPIEDRSGDQSAALSYSDSLVDEVKDADVIIIGTPIYNFGIPASLKAWIDQIARVRVTFKYTENGPVGLLEGKKAIIVTASGGTEIGSEIDFATGYLRHVLGFIGIKDVSVVPASKLMVDQEAALARAQNDIAGIVADMSKRAQSAA